MCHCFALLAASGMFWRREEKWVSKRRETCRWTGRLRELLTSRWVAHRGWPKCSSTLNGQQTVPPPVPRVLSSVLSAHLKNMNGSDATIPGGAHVSERGKKKLKQKNTARTELYVWRECVSVWGGEFGGSQRKEEVKTNMWKLSLILYHHSWSRTPEPPRLPDCERLWGGD